jgi:hypothetical protein
MRRRTCRTSPSRARDGAAAAEGGDRRRVPPAATGDVFGDVPADAFAASWIEDLSAREIAAGCHVQPALYCPGTATTRGQMAALLVSAFGLQ